jgi:hypothetical protein
MSREHTPLPQQTFATSIADTCFRERFSSVSRSKGRK